MLLKLMLMISEVKETPVGTVFNVKPVSGNRLLAQYQSYYAVKSIDGAKASIIV